MPSLFDRLAGRHQSRTLREQCECEALCQPCLNADGSSPGSLGPLFGDDGRVLLIKDDHCDFLRGGISRDLHKDFVSLDASRPWLIYWITHALYLLDFEPRGPRAEAIVATLATMQHPEGGFCGGPGQIAHCAPTYASVLSLATIGTPEALGIINRSALYRFFLSMKQPSGGFAMHRDGEVDCRGTYTVLAIARLCNILTPELTEGAADYILSTQSYEGGFGGEPGTEAHGGYNFCAMAALLILGEYHRLDLDELELWLVRRQLSMEGGFQGRTNKLVDSCYSFWQGGALAIMKIMRNGGGDLYDLHAWELRQAGRDQTINDNDNLEVEAETLETEFVEDVETQEGCLAFDQARLMKYLLHCCQTPVGGLRDKPGKPRDYYHSCYALSGLSIAQHSYLYSNRQLVEGPFSASKADIEISDKAAPSAESSIVELDSDNTALVLGDMCNLINPTSAAFNIGFSKLRLMVDYFGSYPCVHDTLLHS